MVRQLPFRLILASGSLGRRELMKLHGYEFEVRPADLDEPTEARLGDCRHYVAELAWLKAAAVAPKVPDLLDRERIVVTRLLPTPRSMLR